MFEHPQPQLLSSSIALLTSGKDWGVGSVEICSTVSITVFISFGVSKM
jgi:hypothetical protein